MGLFGSGSKTIYVAFAWSDAAAIPITMTDNQTTREAVAPYLPSSIRPDGIGVIDTSGNEVTNVRGANIEEGTRVVVNTTGFVPGGSRMRR